MFKISTFLFVCVIFVLSTSLNAYPFNEDDTQQQQREEIIDFQQFQTNDNNGGSGGRRRLPKQQILPTDEEPCLAPKKVGPCKGWIPKYFFNSETKKCEQFFFGGCEPSPNNFKNLRECEQACSHKLGHVILFPAAESGKNGDICTLPAVKEGAEDCDGFLRKWTFNSEKKQCEEYIYRGCGETKNSFSSKRQCVAACGNQITIEGRANLDKCHLPKDSGSCFARKSQYYFNAKHNRCEKFIYGGCGGNENRFSTAEECLRACGGDAPSNVEACSQVECPWNTYGHYETLNCSPVYDGDSCCPTRYDCPQILPIKPEPEAVSKPQCVYRGKKYSVGDEIPEASVPSACRAGCSCLDRPNGPEIVCAQVECPEFFGIPADKAGCSPLYELGKCCATDFLCPNATKTSVVRETCSIDGKTYTEGQRFYPKSSPCLSCVCKAGFKGELTEEFCEKIDCGIEIYYADKLRKGCAPVYYHESCCPVTWQCPDEQDESDFVPLPYPEGPNQEKFEILEIMPTPVGPNQGQGSRPDDFIPMPMPVGPNQGKGSRPNDFISLPQPYPEGPGQTPSIHVEHKPDDFVTMPTPVGPNQGQGSRRDDFIPMPMPVGPNQGSWDRPNNDFVQMPTPVGPNQGKGSRPDDFIPMPMPVGPNQGKGGPVNFVMAPQPYPEGPGQTPNIEVEHLPDDFIPLPMPVGPNQGEGERPDDFIPMPMPVGPHQKYKQGQNRQVSKSDCELPKAVGICKARRDRYFYNTETKKCEHFFYTGCRGNKNNFFSQADCVQLCEEGNETEGAEVGLFSRGRTGVSPKRANNILLTQVDVCTLPKKVGVCKGYFHRFYFSPELNKCLPFIYGGCRGNGNNFYTKESCESTCSNEITPDDADTNEEDPETPPKFEILSRTIEDDTCTLKAERGSCEAYVKRYFYDAEDKRCKSFIYGGCEGNANNFQEIKDCELRCGVNKSPENMKTFGSSIKTMGSTPAKRWRGGIDTGRCKLPANTGPCFARMEQYHYNVATKECELFVYGGCHGNANRFPTLESCVQNCKIPVENEEEKNGPLVFPEQTDNKVFCGLPPEKGTGSKWELRYYYNQNSQHCIPFHYSGTGGNKNNFLSESDCLSNCGSKPTIEHLSSQGVLTCTFGNLSVPFGKAVYRGRQISGEFLPCGVPVCQCLTPPSLTCFQRRCPTAPRSGGIHGGRGFGGGNNPGFGGGNNSSNPGFGGGNNPGFGGGNNSSNPGFGGGNNPGFGGGNNSSNPGFGGGNNPGFGGDHGGNNPNPGFGGDHGGNNPNPGFGGEHGGNNPNPGFGGGNNPGFGGEHGGNNPNPGYGGEHGGNNPGFGGQHGGNNPGFGKGRGTKQ